MNKFTVRIIFIIGVIVIIILFLYGGIWLIYPIALRFWFPENYHLAEGLGVADLILRWIAAVVTSIIAVSSILGTIWFFLFRKRL